MFLRTHEVVDVALGRAYADLAIFNANLVNVNTKEVQKNVCVYTKGEWICYVGSFDDKKRVGPGTLIIDAKDKYIVPGFIDAHTHLAGQYISPWEGIKYIIPTGTTTLITEVLEPYMIAGIDGIKELMDFYLKQPVKIFFLMPVNISISPLIEDIPDEDIKYFLKRDDVIGIGESYWQEVVVRRKFFTHLFNKVFKARKSIEGHSAGAKGEKLMAYASFGVTSCHEPIKLSEVLERLRLGMYVMIREGGIREDLKEMIPLKDMSIDKRKLILVTDSISPEFLLNRGYLNKAVQKAIDMGFDPMEAIQMVTINPAQHFGIDDFVGSVSPGRHADILILNDLKEIDPYFVISKGKVLVEEGKPMTLCIETDFSSRIKNTIQCNKIFSPSDFKILTKVKNRCRIRVIEFLTELVTKETIEEVEVINGEVLSLPQKDIIKACAVDRSGENMFIGFVKGLGLKKGAVACSSCWDCVDLVVIGVSDEDMAASLNRIIELQGGFVASIDGEILELPLPLFGLLPECSLEETVNRMNKIKNELLKAGFKFKRPWLVLSILTCSAIPFFRICEKGYFNFKENKLKKLFV